MSYISSLFQSIKNLAAQIKPMVIAAWHQYRGLARWLQALLALIAILVIAWVLSMLGSTPIVVNEATLPSVTLARINALSSGDSSISIIGSVRSVSESIVLAQRSGTVTALHARLGTQVSAGFLVAELENATERAALLQAEGAYEAASAARSGASPADIRATALNTFTTAYSTIDILLKSNIDTFFGMAGGLGPQLLISPAPFDSSYFPKRRQALADSMSAWRTKLATAPAQDPQALLDSADTVVKQATALGNDLAEAATKNNSDATAAQLTALVAARAGLTSVQASVTAAKSSYQGQSTSATAGADAAVKIALGSLNAAKAQLEKTFIRAPISGTLNFLPLHTGDYVTQMSHVATLAQNGALEIIAYVSEETRANLSVGAPATIESSYPAIITSIAPALDPVTKQIEVHLALAGKSALVNGQSVRMSLTTAGSATRLTGPLLLPLTALKLTPAARVVFSVDDDSRLVAHPVEIADVHGDRIEITTPLDEDIEVVIDARGLSEGQKVSVTPSMP